MIATAFLSGFEKYNFVHVAVDMLAGYRKKYKIYV